MVWYYPQFQSFTGSLGKYSSWIRGNCCIIYFLIFCLSYSSKPVIYFVYFTDTQPKIKAHEKAFNQLTFFTVHRFKT